MFWRICLTGLALLLFAVTVDGRVGWDCFLRPSQLWNSHVTKITCIVVYWSGLMQCLYLSGTPLVNPVTAQRRKSAFCLTWFVRGMVMRWDIRQHKHERVKWSQQQIMVMRWSALFLQVRHYDSAKWVTTEAESYFMEMAISRGFKKLYKYITGENEAGEFVWGSNLVDITGDQMSI